MMADAKDTIAATARVFWLYQAVALAAALLAFLPDRSASYTDAIDELRRLEGIEITVDDVDASIGPAALTAVGGKVFAAVGSAAAGNNIKLVPGLSANSHYFLVDEGPTSLSFRRTHVADLIQAVDAYAKNPRFVIVAPDPVPLRDELRGQLAGLQGAITSFDIPCNYAPDRCQADVYVNPNGDDVGAQRDLEFYVPRVRPTLPYGVKDLIDARYPALKGSWEGVDALKSVEDEVAELTPGDAVAKLQELRKAEQRPLSVFDVSLSGAAARIVAPVVLAALAFAAWASADGLARLKLPGEEIELSLFIPLIRTRPSRLIATVCLVFPVVVGGGLLFRAGQVGLVPWTVSLVALVLQCSATVALSKSLSELRGDRSDTLRTVGAGGLAIFFVVAIVAWSVATPRRAPPPSAIRAAQAPTNTVVATDQMPANATSTTLPADDPAAELRREEGLDDNGAQ